LKEKTVKEKVKRLDSTETVNVHWLSGVRSCTV